MTAAPKLATLAEVRVWKDPSASVWPMPEDYASKAIELIPRFCATIEHLVATLQAITDAGGTADEIVAARALLAQLGATP